MDYKNCSMPNCKNKPKYIPALNLYAIGWGKSKPPAKAVMGIPVCEEHKSSVTLEQFITDAGWQMILDQFAQAGKCLPDRQLTEMELIEIPKVG